MPGTVQELASTFREAVDPQGNVRDMGVVKEVVSALERSPVSASDLMDLKSTRLGKYINQVRRTIPDKSLAKRMKRLVLQWRSLAQQSPSTSNGIPSSNPSSLSPSPPSPQSTTSSSTLSQNSLSTSQDPQVPPLHPNSSSSLSPSHPPPPLPPPARFPSTPTSNRKRLLQKLSTVKNHPNIPYPTTSVPTVHPSLHSAVSVSLPASNSSQNHTVVASMPSSVTTTTSVSSLALSSSRASSTAILSSESTSVPTPSSSSLLFGSFLDISEEQSLVVSIPLLSVTLSAHTAQAAVAGHSANQTNSHVARGKKRRIRSSRPQSLIVSYSRDLLQIPALRVHHLQEKEEELPMTLSSPAPCTVLPLPHPPRDLRTPSDNSSTLTSSHQSLSTPSPPEQCPEEGQGCYGSDGVWYNWTQCIIHRDSYTVNVLPYVFIDGLDLEDCVS